MGVKRGRHSTLNIQKTNERRKGSMKRNYMARFLALALLTAFSFGGMLASAEGNTQSSDSDEAKARMEPHPGRWHDCWRYRTPDR